MNPLRMFPISLAVKHFATLREGSRIPIRKVLVHFGAPLLTGAGAALMHASVSPNSASTAITALSVFVGLLFNLLVLASSLRLSNRGSVHTDRATEAGRAILTSTQFAIFLAFAAIAVLFPSTIDVNLPLALRSINENARLLVTPLFVVFCTSFAVTMLQVLAKMRVAMERNLELTYAAAPEIANRQPRFVERAADKVAASR